MPLGLANVIDEATTRAKASDDRRAIVHRELLKGWRMCDPQIDEILDDLKKRFRELLGVTKPDALTSR
jgi:hypothetical protein